MKINVLIALGLVASVEANHHKHKSRHMSKLATRQHLQAEIEELREAYNNLEDDYEKLAQFTHKIG